MENSENVIVEESTEETLNESVTESTLETVTEIEDTAEEPVEETAATVSGGDSFEAGFGSDIVEVILSAEQNELFEKNNELLEELIELESQTIMDKPLAQYTPLEGMTLILVVFALGVVLGKIIGGIIPCKQ